MTDAQFAQLMQRIDKLERAMPDADEIVVRVTNEIAGLLAPVQNAVEEVLDALLAVDPDDLDD